MTVRAITPTDDGVRLNGLVRSRREDIQELARRYQISNVRIFGSLARGDSGPDSDVDFLVDLPETASLFDLAGFRRELRAILGVEVDVVSRKALLSRDRDVLEEAVALCKPGNWAAGNTVPF